MPKKSKNIHYVNNQEFSQAVVSYVGTVKEAKEAGKASTCAPPHPAAWPAAPA